MRYFRGFAALNEVHRLGNGFNSQGEEAVKVQRPGGIFGSNVYFLLQKNGTGVNSLVHPKDGQSGADIPLDDGPVYAAGTAVSG